MAWLKFVLTLPEDSKDSLLVVHGGFDSDKDGTIEDNNEALKFERTDDAFEWIAKTDFKGKTKGRLFVVIGLVGRGVKWKLDVTSFLEADEKNGVSVYSYGGRTASLSLRLSDRLES